MEVFIYDIPSYFTESQLQILLAKELHTPAYEHYHRGPGKINFNVHLFPSRSNSNKLTARMTLPSSTLGERFLRDYGYNGFGGYTKSVRAGTRRLKFKASHGAEPRPEVVEELNRLPYEDPTHKADTERRRDFFENNKARIQTLQFGWLTRELVFSSEYGISCPDGAASLIFDDDYRAIRIRVEQSERVRTVMIRFSNIAHSTTYEDEGGLSILFFHLRTPPVYESDPTAADEWFDLEWNGPEWVHTNFDPPQREIAFDKQHARISAYTSHALRLVLRSKGDIDPFRSLCAEANIFEPDTRPVSYGQRSFFDPDVLAQLQSWFAEMDWTVSFQLEYILRSLVMEAKELLTIRPFITHAYNKWGPQRLSAFLKHYGLEMAQGRRTFTARRVTVESAVQCLRRSMEQYKPQVVSQHDREFDSKFDCFHIEVTATSILLSGPYAEQYVIPYKKERCIIQDSKVKSCYSNIRKSVRKFCTGYLRRRGQTTLSDRSARGYSSLYLEPR